MAAHLDLSELNAVDLAALRLGAQVMGHKAQAAARPRVEVFFKGVALSVDEEVVRRRRHREGSDAPESRPFVAPTQLPLAGLSGAIAASPATSEDRRLTAEYLDLLGGNDRLSDPVRHAVRTLREQLGPDS